ncbi:MAG: thioredoxin [Novosphingobium sp.]|nr:thioredoxin [Novosphingobium sp.]
MPTKVVTDASFADDVLNSELPVLVDFWADWCGPCKMIGPALEELSDEFAEKLVIAKLDIVANEETAMRFEVQSIPLLILFKNGEPVAKGLGAAPKSELRNMIESTI